MNELTIFKDAEFGEIRTIQINNEPWFVGKDICQAFGDKNHNRSLGRVDEIDRTQWDIKDALGRNQKILLINESGLYSLLFAMQPQKAHNDGVPDEYPIEVRQRIEKLHKFKRWVTSEVLPSIRKHGMYATDKLLEDPDFAISVLQQLKAEREEKKKLTTVNQQQKQIIGELQPKANYVDIILDNKGLVTITQIAKDYGMSGKKMNALLNTYGVQFKQSGQWLLYSKYHDMGYTHSKTINITRSDGRPDIVMETKWTQKGRLFLYDLLKENGVLPVIESKSA